MNFKLTLAALAVACAVVACGPKPEECPIGQTDCGGTCRDLSTDGQNCGGCGVACSPNQFCQGGFCTAPAPVCGNGQVQGGEACDDGNTANDDGCNANCTVQDGYACSGAPSVCTTVCGDGILAGAEACDDGNAAGGDGCSSACAIEAGFSCAGTPSVCTANCGDGVVAGSETCDDNNNVSGDGCSASCATEPGFTCSGAPSSCFTVCGDGVTAGAESCDDGATVNGDGCSDACEVEPGFTCSGTPSTCAPVCGDGIVTGGEACDDANGVNGDGCSNTCQVESGFDCTGAPSTCTTTCGDGIVAGSEACDDGGTVGGDGCSGACLVENGYTCSGSPSTCATVCGDGIIAGTETCDDGGTGNGDGCSSACAVEPGYSCAGAPSTCSTVCGDGLIAGAEACDDGNAGGGDGCSSACQPETGFTCSGQPSTCTTTCGDGLVAGTETCDDANMVSGDGCSACAVDPGYTCAGSPSVCAITCGNGVMDPGEQCDDANTTGGDGCTACSVDPGYACTGTPSVCAIVCGDGTKAPSEQCDDGNTASGDGCSSTCTVEAGHFWETEPNDDGTPSPQSDFSSAAANGPLTASTIIHAAIDPIGDDDVFAFQNTTAGAISVRFDVWDPAIGIGQSCGTNGVDTRMNIRTAAGASLADNGDKASGDYCSGLTYVIPANTTVYAHVTDFYDQGNGGNLRVFPSYLLQAVYAPVVPACGDGNIDPGEQCDDGNTASGDGCSSTCQIEAAICGNGVLQSGEQCDDGNTTSGDGCSATCQTEPGHYFEVEPNDDGTPSNGSDFSAANANGPFTASVLIHAAITPIGDDDGFRITNSSGAAQIVRFDTWNPALGVGVPCGTSTIDTRIHIRDAAGVSLATNGDRSTSDYCSGLNYTIPAGATVYAVVQRFSESSTISAYLLQVVFLPPPMCGNGTVEAGEQCDDGNTASGDGCSATCQLEFTPFLPCAAGETLVLVQATDVPKTIDASTPSTAPATSSVNVSSAGTVMRVMVGIDDLPHVWVADVSMTLVSPNLANALLIDGQGSDGDNFVNTRFDDACVAPQGQGTIVGKTAPFTGCFVPQAPLAPLQGQPAAGTWTLSIHDTFPSSDHGQLKAWRLGLCIQ